MKFSEAISQVIDLANKANEARAQKARTTAGLPVVTSGAVVASNPTASGLPAITPVQEEVDILRFLESLPPQMVYMLTAVMYLGRGDFDTMNLVDNYHIMGERFGNPKWAARQMADKLSLPQYLKEGGRKLADAQVDLDEIMSTATA
jgi:hypothetical protein